MMFPQCLKPAALVVSFSIIVAGPTFAQTPLPAECSEILDGNRITIVVPNAAGGGYDLYARALAPVLSKISGGSAQVSNMPGGGGKAALVRFSTAQPSELVVLFDAANDTVSSILVDLSLDMKVADFDVAGIIHSEPDAWLGRPEIDLADPALKGIIAASAGLESNLVQVPLVARSLGIESRMVSGYGNSSENVAAILRGEADVSALTLTTALKATDSSETRVLMILDDKQDPSNADIPFLAGAGGLVALRSINESEAERARRQDIARMVVALTFVQRTLFVPARMESASKSCLTAAIGAALTSNDFAEGAKAIKRPINPIVGPEAQAVLAEIATAYQEARPLLDDLMSEMQGE